MNMGAIWLNLAQSGSKQSEHSLECLVSVPGSLLKCVNHFSLKGPSTAGKAWKLGFCLRSVHLHWGDLQLKFMTGVFSFDERLQPEVEH